MSEVAGVPLEQATRCVPVESGRHEEQRNQDTVGLGQDLDNSMACSKPSTIGFLA